jgi:hypothetical protein
MPAAQRTIVIDRPVEPVFSFFSTPSNDLRWRPHVKEIQDPPAMRTGARIRQVIAGPGGRGIDADIEVPQAGGEECYLRTTARAGLMESLSAERALAYGRWAMSMNRRVMQSMLARISRRPARTTSTGAWSSAASSAACSSRNSA